MAITQSDTPSPLPQKRLFWFVLFRFAVRDYYSEDAIIQDAVLFDWPDENGFYARGTAFNDFRVRVVLETPIIR